MMGDDFDWHVLLRPRQDFSIATLNRIVLALDSLGYDWEVVHIRRPARKDEWNTIPHYDLGIRVTVPPTMYTLKYEAAANTMIKGICDYTDLSPNHFKVVQ